MLPTLVCGAYGGQLLCAPQSQGCLAAMHPTTASSTTPTSCCPLPAARCLLPAACCPLPAACCPLPAACAQAGALHLEGFSSRVGKVMPMILDNCTLANNTPAKGKAVSHLGAAMANLQHTGYCSLLLLLMRLYTDAFVTKLWTCRTLPTTSVMVNSTPCFAVLCCATLVHVVLCCATRSPLSRVVVSPLKALRGTGLMAAATEASWSP